MRLPQEFIEDRQVVLNMLVDAAEYNFEYDKHLDDLEYYFQDFKFNWHSWQDYKLQFDVVEVGNKVSDYVDYVEFMRELDSE